MVDHVIGVCRLACAFFIIVICVGCSTPRLTQQLYDEPSEQLPAYFEIENTPFHSQLDYQCGPASLAAILNYRGIELTPEKLKELIYLPQRKGSLQIETVVAARNQGLLVYPLEPSLSDLFKEVASGNPVLVLQNLGVDWFPQWHYAVVIGYDLDRGFVILRSGTTKRLTLPIATFERTWQRGEHWGVVIVTPDQLPSTAKPFPFLKVAQSLEAVGQTLSAQTAYKSALNRWPTNSIALMGLGNTLYSQQQFRAATNTFRRLTEAHPKQAEGWNNLAYALAAQGCKDEAIEAVSCALMKSTQDPKYDESLAEIKTITNTQVKSDNCKTVQCPVTISTRN